MSRNCILKLRVPLQPASSSSLQFTPNYIKNPIIHKDEYYGVADEAMGRHERQQRQLDVDAAVSRHKHFQDVSTSPQASAVTNSVTTSCQTPPLIRKDVSSEVLSAAGTHSGKGGGLTKILKLKVGWAVESLDGKIAVFTIRLLFCRLKVRETL